jgi:hypothetical protein
LVKSDKRRKGQIKRTVRVEKQNQRLNALGQITKEKKGTNEEKFMCSKTKTETANQSREEKDK